MSRPPGTPGAVLPPLKRAAPDRTIWRAPELKGLPPDIADDDKWGPGAHWRTAPTDPRHDRDVRPPRHAAAHGPPRAQRLHPAHLEALRAHRARPLRGGARAPPARDRRSGGLGRHDPGRARADRACRTRGPRRHTALGRGHRRPIEATGVGRSRTSTRRRSPSRPAAAAARASTRARGPGPRRRRPIPRPPPPLPSPRAAAPSGPSSRARTSPTRSPSSRPPTSASSRSRSSRAAPRVRPRARPRRLVARRRGPHRPDPPRRAQHRGRRRDARADPLVHRLLAACAGERGHRQRRARGVAAGPDRDRRLRERRRAAPGGRWRHRPGRGGPARGRARRPRVGGGLVRST